MQQLMRGNFVVLTAVLLHWKPSKSGSTADRLFLRKIIAVSGKNFITAIAAKSGGRGAPIALPQRFRNPICLRHFLGRIAIGTISKTIRVFNRT
jgi:hypothetical protein